MWHEALEIQREHRAAWIFPGIFPDWSSALRAGEDGKTPRGPCCPGSHAPLNLGTQIIPPATQVAIPLSTPVTCLKF